MARRSLIWVVLFVLSALAWGCMGKALHNMHPQFKTHPPRSIAILPVLNETVNLKAAEMARPLLHEWLAKKGYESPTAAVID